jgi:beta-N-acetylhexosaminidase
MAAVRTLAVASMAAVLMLLAACGNPESAEDAAVTPVTAAPKPEPTPEPTAEELRHQRAVELVGALTTRERVASVVMGAAPGIDADTLRAYITGNGLGGFILMSENIPQDPSALRALTDALTVDSALPPLIAVDQEGGEVGRLHWDANPGANELKFADPADTAAAFHARAALLSEAGIGVNFGIVADVPSWEGSFIYGRAYGTDPAEAAVRVGAAASGERGTVLSTIKHFPGHGAAEGDSHYGVPSTDIGLDAWRQSHALPFVAGIDAGAELLMFGHLAYTSIDPLPASLSHEWHRIAREELGFTGIAVSDDLGMLLDSGLPEYQDIAAIMVQSLAAGADLALVIRGVDAQSMPVVLDGMAAAADAGVLPAERLEEAAVRVVELRLELGSG